MRVILACLQSAKRHPIPAYEFWREYFVNGCREAGFEPIEVPGVDWAEGLTYSSSEERAAWRARTWDVVLSFVKRDAEAEQAGFFLGYLYPQQIEGTAIQEIQRIGIPCVNFFCDNVREFRRVPVEYRPFALHWVPEFEAVPMYQRAGLRCLNAPMPCWIGPELRTIPDSEEEPATFIGSSDTLRRDLLGRALAVGAQFVVRGAGWIPDDVPAGHEQGRRSFAQFAANQMAVVRAEGVRGFYHKVAGRLVPLNPPPIPPASMGSPVSRADYVRITRDAAVTIGVNRVPTVRRPLRQPLAYSRLRDIEAPMLGACYLTEWTRGLEELYDPGVEIETYDTAEALAEQLTRLLRDKARRTRMRSLAQRRALGEHTVARSLGRVARSLSIGAVR